MERCGQPSDRCSVASACAAKPIRISAAPAASHTLVPLGVRITPTDPAAAGPPPRDRRRSPPEGCRAFAAAHRGSRSHVSTWLAFTSYRCASWLADTAAHQLLLLSRPEPLLPLCPGKPRASILPWWTLSSKPPPRQGGRPRRVRSGWRRGNWLAVSDNLSLVGAAALQSQAEPGRPPPPTGSRSGSATTATAQL